MKLARLTTLYPQYLKGFYAANPGLANADYRTQKAALDFDAFGWSGMWDNALAPLGYEVLEVSANAVPMQRAWLRERGHAVLGAAGLLDIARAQIHEFKPDILFIEDHNYFPQRWLDEVRASWPRIRLILGWCGAPCRDVSVFRAYDVVLSCIPELVTYFRDQGHRAFHLNHCFDRRILDRINCGASKRIEVSFVGGFRRGRGQHAGRERLFQKIVQTHLVEIYSPAAEVTLADQAQWLALRGLYEGVRVMRRLGIGKERLAGLGLGKVASMAEPPAYPIVPALSPFLRPGVYGLAMYQVLHDSKVTLNNHIDVSPRSASNMRLFEATGVGTCLLTDWKDNLPQLFVPDEEIVPYKTPTECVDKIGWLLEYPIERESIARRGQARTLKDHTFERRASELDHIITAGTRAYRQHAVEGLGR